MVTWPSGKAKVCKTFIHQFKSGRHLHKTVMKKMSQSFFFVVASKIGDFANQFLDTVLQCCPTILVRFSQLDAHFSCRFPEFGRGGGNFFEKKQNKSCCFQNVFNFLAANFLLAAGIFRFSRQFSVCFQIFHFIPINYNKEDFHYEHHYRHRPRLLLSYCGSSKDTTNPLRITSMMSCRVTSEILSIIILSFISR